MSVRQLNQEGAGLASAPPLPEVGETEPTEGRWGVGGLQNMTEGYNSQDSSRQSSMTLGAAAVNSDQVKGGDYMPGGWGGSRDGTAHSHILSRLPEQASHLTSQCMGAFF